VDTMYEIAKDAYYASIHVVGTDEKNIVFTAEESSYFYGKAGMTYLLYPYENTAVTISKAECFSITENEINSASDTVKVFTFDVLEEGYYKIDTELSNAELYVWGGDAWNMVSGTFNHMYQLGKGIFPVVYQPDNEYEIGKYPASAAFTIAKCANNKTINATIEDCYISPEYGGLSSIAEIVVTAPQGTEKVTVGIEYTGPTGELESMTLQDLDFTNTDTQYLRGILYNMELGMTYKIKPYVYSNNDSRNKIYGEEKSYVMSMRKDLKTITHNSYSFETEGRSKYDQYGDMYYLTFVQPEDADTTTYLTLSSFLNIDLYDKDGNRLNLEWVSSLKRSAELKGGERYYLLVRSSADGKAEINVSSLPQASSVEVYSVRPDEILCTVTGNDPQSSVLYAAFYNGTQFLKVDIIENPSGDIAIPLDSALLAKQCKLILMDKTSFEPLCENELVEFTQSSVVAPM